MRQEDIDAVWSQLDRQWLRSVLERGPTPVFATISGAHLYGFASPDSDVDLRGAFLAPLRSFIGLVDAEETISIAETEPVELDWVAHDLRKFCRMLTQHNGYVLEQLYSPLVVADSPAFAELRELARGCVTRKTARHYLGFAHGRRKRLAEPAPTVKHLLYAYRVYLTGIHLLRTGEVLSNLPLLLEAAPDPHIAELVARKRGTAEQQPLAAGELERHHGRLDELEAILLQARDGSSLPDEPTTRAALDDFVVRVRLEAAR